MPLQIKEGRLPGRPVKVTSKAFRFTRWSGDFIELRRAGRLRGSRIQNFLLTRDGFGNF
jgi:hypothetical protein